MQVTEGLFDHMVLQQNSRQVCDVAFRGECSHVGALTIRVTRNGKAVASLAKTVVGRAAGGTFVGRLRGLPVGGPYDISLSIDDGSGARLAAVQVRDVLVGDVWILGGQSNMQGCGPMPESPAPLPNVRAFFMNDRWDVARELLHDFHLAVDPVHIDLLGGIRPPPATRITVGPGLFFGQEMHRRTGVPQGLIPCGHGGTSMAQWDPALKRKGGRSLYGATLRRVRKNGGKVAGMLWYQGCSDAMPDTAPLYTARMEALARHLRKDLATPKLPISIVQISRVIHWEPAAVPAWNSIQDQQRLLPNRIPHCTVVPTIDLALADGIHLNAASQERLGRRLADATQALVEGRRAGPPPIRLRKVTAKMNKVSSMADVIVTFDHVQGRLTAGSRPVGFSLSNHTSGGQVLDTELQGNKVVLHTTCSSPAMEGTLLHYGRGHDPICNITDEADRSLPVLSSVRVGEPRALTAFVQRFSVSPMLPLAGRIDTVDYPTNTAELGLKARAFTTPQADIHLDYAAGDQEAHVVYFAATFDCAHRMKLRVCLGYDGPVKAWIDGCALHCDVNGTNPALPDAARIPFVAAKGTHEVLVALDTNGQQAWGILLRLERVGLSKKALETEPLSCSTMPTLV